MLMLAKLNSDVDLTSEKWPWRAWVKCPWCSTVMWWTTFRSHWVRKHKQTGD